MSTSKLPPATKKRSWPGFTEIGNLTYIQFRRSITGKRHTLTPERAQQYRTHIEPWGVYMVEHPLLRPWAASIGEHRGVVVAKNPLYVYSTQWKDDLSIRYRKKTGKDLTNTILADGYDVVVTFDKYGAGEICALDESQIHRFSQFQVYKKTSLQQQPHEIESLLGAATQGDLDSNSEDLFYLDAGRVLPVPEKEFDIDRESYFQYAKTHGFDTLMVCTPWAEIDADKDVLRPHIMIPLSAHRIHPITSPIWFDLGYSDTNEAMPRAVVHPYNDDSLEPTIRHPKKARSKSTLSI